ncbi:hypothetical protein [Parachlamydia sp. AcF125]|uniref:hypothetical protein n=1 Tax=Parachlamydia sp. AcF125 TaxID=2795736 RepID=UPI001BC9CC0A|nr:hypothetical protein [Parachlamydia sp. AcF125]MBS4168944.1 hypothetical protein [Parachlamydia sp. AcF125]
MENVLFIKNLHEIRSDPKWEEKIEFKNKDKLIDENRLPVGEDFRKRHYKLVAKKVRIFSNQEIALRKICGLFFIFISFGLAYASARFRKFMAKRKTSIHYALLIDPARGNFEKLARISVKKEPLLKNTELDLDKDDGEDLPDILTLTIDADGPLNKPLSTSKFFSEKEGTLSDNQIDMFGFKFLEIPLSHFMNDKDSSNPYYSLLNSSAAELSKDAISKRLEMFERAIQLKKRLKRIPDCKLILRDFLQGWKNSPLKYALASDEEFTRLTLENMQGFEPEFIERVIRKRLIKLAATSRQELEPSIVSFDGLLQLSLIQLYKLEGRWVNQWMGHLPPMAFILFPNSIIKDLNTKWMSEDQIETFFLAEERVHLLSTAQVDRCLDKIPPKLFTRLSDEQIFALNFVYINQEIFNEIFKNSKRGKTLLQSLKPPQLNQLCPYFTGEEWKGLKEEQILSLDYSLMTQAGFEAIFNEFSIPELFQRLAPSKVELVMKYFTLRHWSKLSTDQLIKLDFSEIDPDVLKTFFTQTKGYDLIKSLSLAQIYRAHSYFCTGHWKHLSRKHIIHFNFAKYPINQEIFNAIFREEEEKWNLLGKLPLATINVLSQYFTKGDWGKLSLEVLGQFDYSKIDQAIFDEIFSQQNSNFQTRIQALPVEKLYQLFPYFSEGHWKALKDQQILNFDYSQLKTQENFDKMWPVESKRTETLLPKLTSVAFLKALPFICGERRKWLTGKQIGWMQEREKK